MRSQKEKKKANSRRIIHVSSLTTGSALQKQQEKVKNQQLKQDCILPDLQSSRTNSQSSKQVLLLGLLPRGCRPKSRSLPGRVEVIHPVVHACTTFWLTSTRITLTGVHRQFSQALFTKVEQIEVMRAWDRGYSYALLSYALFYSKGEKKKSM